MDAIDAVLVDLTADRPQLLATHTEPLSPDMQMRLANLAESVQVKVDDLLQADIELGEQFANAANAVVAKGNTPPHNVRAIGSHGQTIRHRPQKAIRATLQIGDPNVIAERTGMLTVADFRRRDMAAGGQGAPLTPTFHSVAFASPDEVRAIVNIGGVANITLLDPTQQDIIGFDSGPGNSLMDRWVEKHRREPFDNQGTWGRAGTLVEELLRKMLLEPYFQYPPPKSTGRELFNLNWIEQQVSNKAYPTQDVQRTLCELTARTINEAIAKSAPNTKRIIIAGGGVRNALLLERLEKLAPDAQICSSADYGVDPDWLEAIAFAWLAKRRLDGQSANMSSVTGADGARVLGGIFAAGPAQDN